MSEDDYAAWVSSYGPPQPRTPLAQVGQNTFAINCSLCHTIDGPDDPIVAASRLDSFLASLDAPVVPGPNLTDLRTRQTLGAGLVDLNADNLRTWLHNPEDIKPGNNMFDRALIYQSGEISLSDEEVEGLIEYLLQLQ